MPDNVIKMSKCCTCSHEWPTGTNGAHHCSAYLNKSLEDLKKENKELRVLLWLRHGCNSPGLYGEDGDLRCRDCKIDFRRASIEAISQGFDNIIKTMLQVGSTKDNEA